VDDASEVRDVHNYLIFEEFIKELSAAIQVQQLEGHHLLSYVDE